MIMDFGDGKVRIDGVVFPRSRSAHFTFSPLEKPLPIGDISEEDSKASGRNHVELFFNFWNIESLDAVIGILVKSRETLASLPGPPKPENGPRGPFGPQDDATASPSEA